MQKKNNAQRMIVEGVIVKTVELLARDAEKRPVKVGNSAWQCTSCGNVLSSKTKFCPECGQRFDWSNPAMKEWKSNVMGRFTKVE